MLLMDKERRDYFKMLHIPREGNETKPMHYCFWHPRTLSLHWKNGFPSLRFSGVLTNVEGLKVFKRFKSSFLYKIIANFFSSTDVITLYMIIWKMEFGNEELLLEFGKLRTVYSVKNWSLIIIIFSTAEKQNN